LASEKLNHKLNEESVRASQVTTQLKEENAEMKKQLKIAQETSKEFENQLKSEQHFNKKGTCQITNYSCGEHGSSDKRVFSNKTQ